MSKLRIPTLQDYIDFITRRKQQEQAAELIFVKACLQAEKEGKLATHAVVLGAGNLYRLFNNGLLYADVHQSQQKIHKLTNQKPVYYYDTDKETGTELLIGQETAE